MEVAAALLEQTTRRAQREFDIRPPLLTLLGAVLFLVAFGAVCFPLLLCQAAVA
jgi:hypothetical protein